MFGAEDIVYSLGNERYQSLRLVESLGEFTLPAEDSAILNNVEPKTVKHRKSKRKEDQSSDVHSCCIIYTEIHLHLIFIIYDFVIIHAGPAYTGPAFLFSLFNIV